MSVTTTTLIFSIKLQKNCTISACRTSGSASIMHPQLFRAVCASNRRYGSIVMLSIHSLGVDNEGNMKSSRIMPRKESSESPPSLGAPNWLKWTLGSILWLSLPSWRKLQGVKEMLNKVDAVVEVVETVAEVTEKISSEAADQLPDGGRMKKAALALEQASEQVQKDVQAIHGFIDKVEGQVDGWKEKLNETGTVSRKEGAL